MFLCGCVGAFICVTAKTFGLNVHPAPLSPSLVSLSRSTAAAPSDEHDV